MIGKGMAVEKDSRADRGSCATKAIFKKKTPQPNFKLGGGIILQSTLARTQITALL